MIDLVALRVSEDLPSASARYVVEMRFVDDESERTEFGYSWDKYLCISFEKWDKDIRQKIGDKITHIIMFGNLDL